MKDALTERQRSVLNFIIEYLSQHGYPPSIREIGRSLRIKSLRGVTIHLDSLERKGFIRRERTSRSIKVLKQPDSGTHEGFVWLPILGTIAAGAPLLAVENVDGTLPIPRTIVGNTKEAFLLRVRGDSMVGAHILPGDLVVIRPQQTADNGDLVAALIGDEATVIRLRIENDSAVLMPANPAYEPIPLSGNEVRLIGKVIALIRNY